MKFEIGDKVAVKSFPNTVGEIVGTPSNSITGYGVKINGAVYYSYEHELQRISKFAIGDSVLYQLYGGKTDGVVGKVLKIDTTYKEEGGFKYFVQWDELGGYWYGEWELKEAPQPPPNTKRRKRILVTPEGATALMRDFGKLEIEPALPSDIKILGFNYDILTARYVITVESETFEPVLEGGILPELKLRFKKKVVTEEYI